MIGRLLAVAAVACLGFVETAAAQSSGMRGCVMYEHAGFGGRSMTMRPGSAVSFRSGDFWNDRVSSTRVGRGCILVAYEHSNMRGRSIEMEGRTPRLGRWNDRISSAECYCRRGHGGNSGWGRSFEDDDFTGRSPSGSSFRGDDFYDE